MARKKLPEEYISISEARALIGCGAEQIMNAMRNGTFPVGTAFFSDVKWTYRIPRQEFYKVFRPDLLQTSAETSMNVV